MRHWFVALLVMTCFAAQASNGIEGSEQIWLAAIGASIAARGPVATAEEATQAQIAATLLHALGIDRTAFDPAAAPALVELFEY